MRKFTFLLTLLMAFMTTAMAQLDTNKEYRVKHTDSGLFMNASSYDAHPTGPTGGVNFVAEAESDDQVFIVEAEGTGYKLKTKSGKYIFCQQWNVDALDNATTLTFVDNGDGTFKMKWSGGYFKVENVGGTYYPFCDAGLGVAANFELVEVAAVEPEVPATPLEVVSVSPSEAVASLSELTITFSDEVAGEFNPYEMSKFMKLKKGNSVAAGVSNYVVNGAVLTVTLDKEVTEAGEYTLVIPEGLITRKSDSVAYSGELTFTVAEATPEVPNAELAATYKGQLDMTSHPVLPTMVDVTFSFNKDEDGNDKDGYVHMYFYAQGAGPLVSQCVPYEVKGNKVIVKGVTVATEANNSEDTKEVDLTFTVQEDGTLLSTDQVYPAGFLSALLIDFSTITLAPEAAPVVPEVPAVTEAELKLTFAREGDNVTVNVAGLEGVTASIVGKSHNYKDLNVANANTIICPDVNGNTNPTITYALQLNGVPANLNLKGMALDIHALNGGGNYQDNKDAKNRQWNVVVAQGETTVANFADIEISQGEEEGRSSSNNHKVHAVEVAEGPAATDPMTFNFTITKGTTNDGCFFGLSEITLNYGSDATEEPEQPEVPALELADKYTATFDAGGLAVAGELLFDQDLDGNAKAGYAALKFTAMGETIGDCVAYETTENTVVLKSVTVGNGDAWSGQTKEVDIVFTVQENGSLLGDQKIYGNTQATCWIGLELTTTAFVPEASTPETPEALELVSIEPADGAQITEFNTVTFTFNKPVKLVESNETGVVLYVNGMPAGQLWGEVPAEGSKTVVLSMGTPVNMEGTYTVNAMEGAFEDLDGNKSAEIMVNYTLAGAQDGFTYTYAAPTTDKVQSSMSYITLGFASEVAEVKTDALNVVDGNGNVVTTATLEADWFDPQAVSVTFAEEVAYTGTCSLTVPAQFITSTLGTYNPEFTLTYNLEAEPVQAYFYHPEYNAVMVMDSVANVATIKKNFTLEDMEANAWELHPVGKNQFKIANKATGLYLGTCNTSVAVAGVDAANAKVYEMQKDGIYDVLKDVEGGNYNYLHVAASQSDKIVGWEAAAAASHWFVLNYVEDYEYLLANLELVDSLNQVIAKAEALKEQAQPYYKPLITSATQFTSNAKEASEGSYEALLDGKDNTFFHTEWSAATTSDAHNLQVLVPGNELTELWVKYQARNAGGAYNDRPTKMSIYGGTMAEDGTVTYETTAFANLTTADGIGEVAGEFKFTADKAYDAFKFEVHETVMSTGDKGNKWFTYGEFQMYSQTMTPADVTMNETQAAGLDEALEYAKNANPVEDAYSVLIDELNRAINKVLFPAATVESVDPACGHYTEMPGTVKLAFSADVQALEFGMVRTDFTGFRGYSLSEEDYTINGKELTVTVPAEYVTNAANMMITLGVIDANGQYVTYASDPDYLSEDCVFLMYTADMKSNIFMMSAVDPEEGEVETLDVINMTFGEGNTYVGGFDTTKEVVVLNADGDVVTKATMEVVKESEVDPDTNETYSWPTATVKFTLAAPVTEAGEYTLVVPEGTVYNEGFYEDAEDFGVEWGAIYNPEVRVAYTVAGAPVDPYAPRHNGYKERSDRNVTAVKLSGWLGEQVYNLTATEQSQDFTDATAVATFKAVAGEELTAVVEHAGEWVHHAVYVDYDADGFTSGIEEGSEWKPAGDLVSYSFYNNGGSSDEYGYNSVGTSISGMDRHMPKLPVFTAPTVPGTYRVRFVQTWCNIDPAGDADGKFGDFKGNGDQIVDVLLEVGEYTGINGVSVENMNDVYTLDGRKVVVKAGQKLNKGLYIVGGKKVYVK